MIIGQAALESGWGKSRFAVKGNNLFGIRTFRVSTTFKTIRCRKMVRLGCKSIC